MYNKDEWFVLQNILVVYSVSQQLPIGPPSSSVICNQSVIFLMTLLPSPPIAIM